MRDLSRYTSTKSNKLTKSMLTNILGSDSQDKLSKASDLPLINMKWRKSAKIAQSMGQTLRSPSEFPEGTWGFRRNDIMIVHRSGIKIHCSSEQEARSIGYRYLPEEAEGTWRRSIFPFGGLRGDAKSYGFQKRRRKEAPNQASFKS